MYTLYYDVNKQNNKSTNLLRHGRKFCVSEIRQNQGNHEMKGHNGAYNPCQPQSRREGTVCATERRECRHSLPGILTQGGHLA